MSQQLPFPAPDSAPPVLPSCHSTDESCIPGSRQLHCINIHRPATISQSTDRSPEHSEPASFNGSAEQDCHRAARDEYAGELLPGSIVKNPATGIGGDNCFKHPIGKWEPVSAASDNQQPPLPGASQHGTRRVYSNCTRPPRSNLAQQEPGTTTNIQQAA